MSSTERTVAVSRPPVWESPLFERHLCFFKALVLFVCFFLPLGLLHLCPVTSFLDVRVFGAEFFSDLDI